MIEIDPQIYNSLICVFYTIFMLIVWFEGDVTRLFSNVFNNAKIFKRDEYEQYQITENIDATFPEFLYEKYPSFFTKVLSCPICFTFWTTLIHSILILKLNFIFILPFNYYLTLFLYLSIRKLLR